MPRTGASAWVPGHLASVSGLDMAVTVTAALFDVDGTLVDSNYPHAVTWWEAFAQAGHDVAMAAIHWAVGMGSDQLLNAPLAAGRDAAAHPRYRPQAGRSACHLADLS